MNPDQNETVEQDVTAEDLIEEVSIDGQIGRASCRERV